MADKLAEGQGGTPLPETEIPAAEQAEIETQEQEQEQQGAEPAAEAEDQPETQDGDPEPEPGAKKETLDWRERRRIQEVNKRREAEKRAAAAEAELARLRQGDQNPADPGSPEAIRQQVESEIQQRMRAQEFNAACNRTFDQGTQEFTDFVDARDSLMQNFGDEINSSPAFLEAITDLPNGHKVFYHLGKNPEEAERLLSLSPVKMAVQIAKLGEKIARPAAKPISQAPKPVRPAPGVVETGTRLDDPNTPMNAWADAFLKGVKRK